MIYAAIDYTSPIGNFGEILAFGGQMILIGMGTIFAVLCLLWLCLSIFKTIFSKASVKKEQAPEVATAVMPTAEQVSNDEEIIAAIAAAIAMAEGECEHAKFRVVSFKRK